MAAVNELHLNMNSQYLATQTLLSLSSRARFSKLNPPFVSQWCRRPGKKLFSCHLVNAYRWRGKNKRRNPGRSKDSWTKQNKWKQSIFISLWNSSARAEFEEGYNSLSAETTCRDNWTRLWGRASRAANEVAQHKPVQKPKGILWKTKVTAVKTPEAHAHNSENVPFSSASCRQDHCSAALSTTQVFENVF